MAVFWNVMPCGFGRQIPTFRRSMLLPSSRYFSSPMMEVDRTSQTSMFYYRTTRRLADRRLMFIVTGVRTSVVATSKKPIELKIGIEIVYSLFFHIYVCICVYTYICVYKGQSHVMAQAVRRRPPTAEARVGFRVSPCGICGGQSGTETGFSPSTLVFRCQFLSTGAALLGKGQEIIIIFIIIMSYSSSQGCTRSLKAGVRS
jgi:hypothetical protein